MQLRVPYLFARPRRLIEIAPERPLSPNHNDMQPPKGMRAAYLAAQLAEGHRPALRLFDHSEGFDFGSHWRWEHGEMTYTVKGLRWLAEEFDKAVSPDAARIIRTEADGLEQIIAASPPMKPSPPSDKSRGTVPIAATAASWLNRWENARP
jgi:hypothetical protein